MMSNNLHLVLRNRPDIAEQWSADVIALRWCRIFPPRQDATGEPVEPNEHDLTMLTANSDRLAELRERLANLSWFIFKQAAGRSGSLVDGAAPLAALIPGQGGGSSRLCIGHQLDIEPSKDTSMRLPLEESERLAPQLTARRRLDRASRSTSSRQVITHTRRLS